MQNMQELINKVAVYVEEYMNHYDGSHDFNHIKRVVGLAHYIRNQITKSTPSSNTSPQSLDRDVITLSALLHDVGDRKYVQDGEDTTTMVRDILLRFGASEALAEKVQTICLGVSYSSENKDLAYIVELIARYPELAVVQDADRIDAIGAVGIGRLFTYGGARLGRSMDESVNILDVRLYKLEDLMKTAPGMELARERTQRLRVFHQWWKEEMKVGVFDIAVLNEDVDADSLSQKLDE
jgi:uncharacterized protein